MQNKSAHLISKIKKHIINKRYIEAEKYLREIELKSNNDPSNYYLIGTIYQDLKKYEKAIQYFLKLEELYSHDIEILKNLGYCYAITNNIKKSIHYYEKIAMIEPSNIEAHYNMACECIKIQQYSHFN